METTTQPTRQTHHFEFRGATPAYFKIWLVNVLLSIITIGFYSPWAKVRTRRYFYGNTFIAGANFEYHANPWSILAARLVLVALIVGGAIVAGNDPLRSAVHSSLLFLLFPWALVRGFAFNARNSSHRGIRFGFVRRYRRLYWIYLPVTASVIMLNWVILLAANEDEYFSPPPDFIRQLPEIVTDASVGLYVLTLVAVFALAPWMNRAYHAFKAEHHRLGGMPFAFERPRIAPYLHALWLVPFIVVILAVTGTLLMFLDVIQLGEWSDLEPTVSAALWFALMFPFAWLFVTTMLFKLYWRGVTAEHGRIICSLSVWRFTLLIRLVNIVAIILTLGLALPWARIRRVRHLAAHLAVEAEPELMQTLAAGAEQTGGAFGEAFVGSEGFDFDVGLV